MICLGQGGLRSLIASSLNYYAHVVNKDTNHGSAYSRRARAASLLQKNHTRTALNYLYCYVKEYGHRLSGDCHRQKSTG